MGKEPFWLSFTLPSLQGEGYLLIAQKAIADLSGLTLGTPIDEALLPEFYSFLILEAEAALKKSGAFPELNFDWSLSAPLEEGSPCLVVDLEASAGEIPVAVRIALTPALRQSLKEKFTPPKLFAYPPSFPASVPVTLHVKGGVLDLTRSEWKSVKVGDYLFLDRCSLEKGKVLITFNGTSLFRGKLKDGNIMVLEDPILQEVQTPMADTEEFEDEEFEDEESEFDKEHTSEEETEEDDLENEESEETETEEESEIEEETEEEEHTDEEKSPEEQKSSTAVISPKKDENKLVQAETIPLNISVEVGRIQMSVKQLLELAPGNIIELNVKPEDGVDLVVNGRCIGKGELVKIGESLAVQLTDKA